MQIYTILTTLFFAGTALACPNGPYALGSNCSGNCVGAQRCSTLDNNVVRTAVSCSQRLAGFRSSFRDLTPPRVIQPPSVCFVGV